MRPRQQTKIRTAVRYIAGRPLDGYPRSNATFLRRGTEPHSGELPNRWDMLAGWQRAAARVGLPAAAILGAVSYAEAPVATEAGAGTGAAAMAAYGAYRAQRAVRNWRHRRRVIRPLVAALAPVVEIPPAEVADRLITPGTHGGTSVRVPLPDHYRGKSSQVDDVSRIVSQRLGGEWDSDLQLRESPFYVHFSPRPAPPESVTWAMVRDAVLATSQDRPVLGLGARSDVIHLDFTGEIAHLAASIGTGGGKSSFLRFLIAQFAHHGVRSFTVCDVKWVSLQGMEDVPGLRIYRHVEEIWEAIAKERREMDRRYEILLQNPGKIFPRRVIVLEEQNAFALETALVWREMKAKKDPALAPVWTDIALLLVKARAVNMNVIGVYQRMSADASGGGVLRDQYGLKLLSRFSPQAWDTLVGTRPRAASSAVPGRAIAVLGGLQRQVQLPFITVGDAMELATSGPAVTVTAEPSQQAKPVTRPVVTPTYTLAEAAREEWCPVSYDNLRQRKSRGKLHLPPGDRWTREELVAALSNPIQRGEVTR
jgi:hypothetical protein